MPIYKVQAPDGGTIRVEAPAGATQEQVISFAQQNYKPPKQPKQTAEAPKSVYEQTADDQSFGENLLAGIGGGMTSLTLGAGQALGLVDQDTVDYYKDVNDGLNTSGGGFTGNILGQAALAAPTAFIPGANTYAGASLVGAGMGAAQPTRENESRLLNTAMGAAGGAGGKYVGDKVVRMLGGNPNAGLNAAQQQALEKGKALGFKQTPGYSTGSAGLQKLEARLESSPWTSRPFDDLKDHNQTIINKIASRAIGEESDVVDATILQKAQDRLGDVYKSVATNNRTSIDADKVLDDLARIESSSEGLLPKNLVDDQLVKKYMKFAESGEASGKQLQSLSSKLGTQSNKQMTTPMGDRDYGIALAQVKESVDDLLAKTLDAQKRDAFNEARKQYRNLMLLTERNTVLNPSDGNIKGNALAGLLQKKDKRGFLYGRNDSDLYNAARFSQAFQPIVGNSGTATRSAGNTWQELLGGLTTNQLARIYTSPPAQRMLQLTEGGILPGIHMNPDAISRIGLLGGATAINQLNQ